jgi:hypothetical protein
MVRDLGFGEGTVLPEYGSHCLSGIPSTLLSLFGIRDGRPGLPDDVFEGVDTTGIEKVVFFVFDGFGFREWKRQERAGFVRSVSEHGRVTPITTVFPSTTSTALTTLATGLTPQEHGLIEWYMYLSELDMVIETLPFSPMGAGRGDQLRSIADPRVLFEGETIYKRLRASGVGVQSFLPKSIAQSGYSSVAHEGTDVVAYSKASDLVASLRSRIESAPAPSLFYVYWPVVDTVEHVYGPDTEEARLEADMISHELSEGLALRLGGSTAGRTLFIATADHGQILSPTRDAFRLDGDALLLEGLEVSREGRKMLPWGGTRDLYLQAKSESLEELREHLSQVLGDRASVLKTSDVAGSGLFGTGPPSEKLESRVGNLMVLPTGKNGVWYQHPGVEGHGMRGVHGGLHADEMTIPFAVARGTSVAG